MPPKRGILVRFQSGGPTTCSKNSNQIQQTRPCHRRAGFLLSKPFRRGSIGYQHFLGTFAGTFFDLKTRYHQGCTMALTDTFVRQVKHSGAPAGDKYTDGQGMFLLVKAAGKYWRMNFRFAEKQKTLALGVYPAVSLAKARKRREAARELLADGIDPSQAKQDDKRTKISTAAQTFEVVARQWLAKTGPDRASSTQEKVTNWLTKNVFPYIGQKPIATISPRDVLATVQKMEERGSIDSAHRVKQICGQVFRYAVASGFASRDVTADLKGALAVPEKGHFAAITEPKQLAPPTPGYSRLRRTPVCHSSVEALAISVCKARRATRRRMDRNQSRSGGVANTRLQNENGQRSHRSAFNSGTRNIAFGFTLVRS